MTPQPYPDPPLSGEAPQVARESAAHAATRAAQSSRIRLCEAGHGVSETVTRFVREQPCVALATALGAGILIGWCAARCDL